jgi:isopentenyl-diphosphate delta-isomerase
MVKGTIAKRKKDHLKIALSDDAQKGRTGLEEYHFVHNALPEMNFDDITTGTRFLRKEVSYPFFISCMTGGVVGGQRLNKNLAKAAQKKGVAMGVGSQRVAVEHPELRKLFEVRKYAKTVPVMANVGLVQLNYGFGVRQIRDIVEMVDADALVFHVNPIQEVIQPEGDRNFANLLPKLSKIIEKVGVPIIVKEVGFGLSEDVVRRLYKIGVRIFDTAGWGGTNWAYVEGERRGAYEGLGELFSDWGVSTADSLLSVARIKKGKKGRMTILGSGGIRNGVEVAKVLALGADMAGIATPFAKAALVSSESVEKLIDRLGYELRVAMFGVGAKNIKQLQQSSLIRTN